MRKVLLAGSTNAWLRERATKAAFVRRSVWRSCRASGSRTRWRRRAELQPQGITTILTRLGENLTKVGGSRGGHAALPRGARQGRAAGLDAQISVKPTQLGLDLDRAMCERNLDRLLGARRPAQQLPLDRHGEFAATSIPRWSCSAARGPDPPHRHRAAGLPLSHREGRRVADSARPGDPDRQGRLPRAAGGRLPEEVGRRRELLQAVRAADGARTRSRPARCCTSPRTTRRSPTASTPTRAHHGAASAYEFAMLYGIQRRRSSSAGRAKASGCAC